MLSRRGQRGGAKKPPQFSDLKRTLQSLCSQGHLLALFFSFSGSLIIKLFELLMDIENYQRV